MATGIVRFTDGSRVALKNKGISGTVTGLNTVKTSPGRGRPKTMVFVELDDGNMTEVGLADLRAI